MTEKDLNEKCQLLKAGYVVEIDGNFFKAIHLGKNELRSHCYDCSILSLCKGNVTEICVNLETFLDHRWILKLASEV